MLEIIDKKCDGCGGNVYSRFVICQNKIGNPSHKKIVCSISGGADSDIMLDWIHSVDVDKKTTYVFFDTGLEYQATKRHLDYLENKYDIKIKRRKAIKPIPLCCKQYGQPFLSKRISDIMERLQRHNFKWENESFEVLWKRYPKCKSALRWWCNEWGENSSFNIKKNKLLKEAIIANPPQFKISAKCCDYAKKKVAKQEHKENKYDLSCQGVRQAEGGARATIYKNCFTLYNDRASEFRPLFFITDGDKLAYKEKNKIVYSDCYEVWGMKRTGCAGCPFGNFEYELSVIERHEPNFAKAANSIFGNSYEYTRYYKRYKSILTALNGSTTHDSNEATNVSS